MATLNQNRNVMQIITECQVKNMDFVQKNVAARAYLVGKVPKWSVLEW